MGKKSLKIEKDLKIFHLKNLKRIDLKNKNYFIISNQFWIS